MSIHSLSGPHAAPMARKASWISSSEATIFRPSGTTSPTVGKLPGWQLSATMAAAARALAPTEAPNYLAVRRGRCERSLHHLECGGRIFGFCEFIEQVERLIALDWSNRQNVGGNVSKAGDYCAKLFVFTGQTHYAAGQACVNIH